jgi:hypothetical protein
LDEPLSASLMPESSSAESAPMSDRLEVSFPLSLYVYVSEPPVMLPEPLIASVCVSLSVKPSLPVVASVLLSPVESDPPDASLWLRTSDSVYVSDPVSSLPSVCVAVLPEPKVTLSVAPPVSFSVNSSPSGV